jgi:4-hydroxybenzoate polyprenyltransferase
MFAKIRQLLEMIRFSHTLFALPFALLAAVMAWSVPTSQGDRVSFRWLDLCGILACMVFARSAAMAFNRIADRHLDAANPRTAKRHLPSGRLSLRHVVVFTTANVIGFVLATLLFLPNWLPLACSLPVLLFLLGYSYAKRFTTLAHFWLGVALMLSPIAAWVAIRGAEVIDHPMDALPVMILGAAVLCWVAGFDMIYACQDVDFDVTNKLYSVPAKLGVSGALRVAAICHLLMLVVLAALPWTEHLGGPPLNLGIIYWTSLAAVGTLLFYEHSLVQPDDLTRVNTAFFRVNALISIGLFVVVSADVLI